MKKTVFFSWASDFNNSKSHNEMIINCLKIAMIKSGNSDLHLVSSQQTENEQPILTEYSLNSDNELESKEYELQNATSGELGSPNIETTIFDRIAKCCLYVCDISIALKEQEITPQTSGKGEKTTFSISLKDKENGRKSPNPNVLLELGFAIHTLGWKHIIMFFDNATYKPEDLPFDIRSHIPICFNGGKLDKILKEFSKKKDKSMFELYTSQKEISSIIDIVVENFKPIDSFITREMQYRIDSIFLTLLKPFSDILYCLESTYYGIEHFLSLDENKIDDLFKRKENFNFYQISHPYDSFCRKEGEVINSTYFVDNIINILTTSNLYDNKWLAVLLNLKYRFILLSGISEHLCCNNNCNVNDYKRLALKLIIITKEWLEVTGRNKFEKTIYQTPNQHNELLNFTQHRSQYLGKTIEDVINEEYFEQHYDEIIEQQEESDFQAESYWRMEEEEQTRLLLERYKNAEPNEIILAYKYLNGEKVFLGEFFQNTKMKDGEGNFLYKLDS